MEMNVSKRKSMMDSLLRPEIVKAVIDLIKENCCITMEEVAKRAGVSKGSLYNYFNNKEDLMQYVHTEMLCPIREGMAAIVTSPVSPKVKLCDFISQALTKDAHDDLCLYFRYLDTQRTVEEEEKEAEQLMIAPLAALLEEGIEAGEFIQSNSLIIAHMIFGILQGAWKTIQLTDKSESDFIKTKQEVLKLVERLIIR